MATGMWLFINFSHKWQSHFLSQAADLARYRNKQIVYFFSNSRHYFQLAWLVGGHSACCCLFSIVITLELEFFLQKAMEECSQEPVEYLKVAGEEPEPSEGELFEEGDRDDKEEPAGFTSLDYQSFEETLYWWATSPQWLRQVTPLADDKCQFHVVSVMHYRPIRSWYISCLS